MFKALALQKCKIRRVVLKKAKAAWTTAVENEKDAAKVLAAKEAAQNDAELKSVDDEESKNHVDVLWGGEERNCKYENS